MGSNGSRILDDDLAGVAGYDAHMQSLGKTSEAVYACGHKIGGRNLIVCVDGTANQFGDRNTNVIEVYNMILKELGDDQHTWYNSGIGTYAQPHWKFLSYYQEILSNMTDMVIAWNFDRTVQGAYRWLSDNYQPGDCIFLFGFSRGAFQVRALSAMIDKVGLIYKGNEMQIPFAYELYADPNSGNIDDSVVPVGSKSDKPEIRVSKATRFKRAFCRDVKVHFVGAWDTVSSIGFARGKNILPGTTEGMQHVCYFRQALALDERRVKFLPEYAWGGSATGPSSSGTETQGFDGPQNMIYSKTKTPPRTLEVWFAGTHSDIGGGNAYNAEMNRSRPPLRWMVDEAKALGLRIKPFDRELTQEEQINFVESLKGVWNIFEIIPFERLTFTRRVEGKATTRRPHLRAARKIHKGQKIHSSLILGVKTYMPKASLPDDPQYESWEKLREDGLANSHDVLEIDLVEYMARMVKKFVDQPAEEKNIREMLGQILEGGSGPQVFYDEVVQTVQSLGKTESTPPPQTFFGEPAKDVPSPGKKSSNLDAQYRLLRLTEDLLLSKAASLTLVETYRVRDALSPLLRGGGLEEHREAADTFLRQLTRRVCLFKLSGHKMGVDCVAISPDGMRIYSGSDDKTIRIWDTQTGDMVKQLEGHTGWVTSLAISGDGARIVSGSQDSTIRIWDVQTWSMIRVLEGHSDWVFGVAISLDGKRIVSGSQDKTIRIWDAHTGEILNKLEGHTDRVNSVAFSPDGSRVFSVSLDMSLRVWDVQTGVMLRVLKGNIGEGTVAVSPNGKRVVAGSKDGLVRIWDAQTGDLLKKLEGHTEWVKGVAISSDGRHIVSGSGDTTVRIWDMRTGDELTKLEGHWMLAGAVAISADGTRVVSGSQDQSVRVWDSQLRSNGEVGQFIMPQGLPVPEDRGYNLLSEVPTHPWPLSF